MTTFPVPAHSWLRIIDIVRDGLLAVLVVSVTIMVGVAIGVSALGRLDPVAPGAPALAPSPSPQTSPLPPDARR